MLITIVVVTVIVVIVVWSRAGPNIMYMSDYNYDKLLLLSSLLLLHYTGLGRLDVDIPVSTQATMMVSPSFILKLNNSNDI